MRIQVVISMAAGVSFSLGTMAQQASNSKTTPLIEWHCVGEKGLDSVTNVATLRAVWALPEAKTWRAAAIDMFATQASRHFSQGKTNQELAHLISPLLNDLVAAETKFDLRGSRSNDVSWALAVRIPQDRVDQWSSNLWKLAAASELGEPKGKKSDWTGRNARDNYAVKFAEDHGWAVITGGYGSLDAEKSFAKGLKPAKPSEYLLKAKADLPALKNVLGLKRLDHIPAIDLTVSPRGDGLRSEMALRSAEDLGIKVEKWNVPTNTIRDPMIGFTAVQGVQKRLQESKLVQSFQPEKVPNQVFIWSRSISPFGSYFAADVGNPNKIMETIQTTLLPKWMETISKTSMGRLEYKTNQHSLAWLELPLLVPFLRPAPEPESQFLLGGFFPTTESKMKPMPHELLDQLQEKDLVYYDWEITEARLLQFKVLWQANRIVRNRMLPVDTAPSEKFIAAIAPKLGNTITDATLVGPKEIRLVRRSHIGLNALELVLLAHIIDPDLPFAFTPHPPRPEGQQRTTKSSRPPGRTSPPPLNRTPAPKQAKPATEPKVQ
jgi:hypothetical protein